MALGLDRVCVIIARTRHKMVQIELEEAVHRGAKFLELRLDFFAKAVDFKRLLQGTEGAPDNFELSLVRTGGDYYTPRHRHNFDQVRLCLEGAMNWAPGRDLTAGMAGYFPEGTFYGPQADKQGSIVMLLQMGGAAGHGFMSYAQLGAGYEVLRPRGSFDGGAFTSRDAQGRTPDGIVAGGTGARSPRRS